MNQARTTAEIECEELAGLLATTGGSDRPTTRMPAITLETLLAVDAPPALWQPPRPATYLAGGTTARRTSLAYRRIAVIAISAAVTVSAVLGLASIA